MKQGLNVLLYTDASFKIKYVKTCYVVCSMLYENNN